MFASLKTKYFLSDKGISGVKRGIFWTTLTNIIVMGGMAFLFLVMAGFIDHLSTGAGLPAPVPIIDGLVVFLVLLFASNWQQYYTTTRTASSTRNAATSASKSPSVCASSRSRSSAGAIWPTSPRPSWETPR